jgi:hypothetical protein
VAVVPGVAASAEPPKASVRLLTQVSWVRFEPYGFPPPEVYLDLSERPFESVELGLRAAAVLGPTLAPLEASLNVAVRWRPDGWAPEDAVWVQVSPLGARRLQLGFDPFLRLGSRVPGQSSPFALTAGVNRGPWRAWAGVKSALLLNELTKEAERSHSVLVEGEWSSPRHWNVALEGAYLPDGLIPALADQGLARHAMTVAGAARVIFRSAGEIGAPLDLDRIQATPWGNEGLFAFPPPVRSPLSVEVMVEGDLGEQWLEDPLQFGVVKPQVLAGVSASLRASLVENTRVQLGALARTPGWLVANQFGFPPFMRFQDGAARWDDLQVEASADRELVGTGFTPGVLVRYRRPGGIVTDLGLGPRTVVLDEQAGGSLLPDAFEPRGVLSAMVTGMWRPAPFIGVFGLVGYEYDLNRVVFVDLVPVWAPAHVFRLHGAVQVGF